MADIRITPASSIMAFTSSLNFKETLTQEASGSLTLLGSGSTGRTDLFTVNGNNGTLFSVSDDLSNSLFSVNTIAGLPVIEAFANNTVIMGQYGQNVLVVTGSRVGIGTTSPNRLLTVAGTTSGLIAFNASSYRNTTIGSDVFGNFIVYDDTAGAYRMVINSSGNVGIGTTTPTSKLQINFDDDLLTRTLILKNISSGSYSAAAVDFQTTNNSPFSILQFNNTIASYAPGDVIFLNQSSGSKIWFGNSGNANRVVIANNNNVGINTATPTRTLDVNGDIGASTESLLFDSSVKSLWVGEENISVPAMSYDLFPGTTSAITSDTLNLSSDRLAKGTIIYNDKYRGTVVREQLVVFDQATDGWKLALATTAKCTCLLGIALKDGNNGDPATVLIEGLVTTSYTGEISTLQRGTPLFISATTAGQTIDSAPSTAGQFVRGVGWIAGTDGSGITIFFQPDISWKVV